MSVNLGVPEATKIKLKPTIYNNIAIFGYSGKKSGMEMEDLKRVQLNSIHPFTIFMVHTTISDVIGNIPMESIDKSKLPLANYYALGHIHQIFQKKEINSHYVYPGPIFPNNFQELVDLKYGSFQVSEIDTAGHIRTQNIKIPLKEAVYLELELDNGLTATEKIISEIDRLNLNNKIFLLKLKGILTQGKTGDIRFNEIEEFVEKKQAHVFLRNISALKIQESGIELESGGIENVENLEEKIIEEYAERNPADFNKFLPHLMNILSIEKNEDEKAIIFENRLLDELKKELNLRGVIE